MAMETHELPSKLLNDGNNIISENQATYGVGSGSEPGFNWFGSSGSSSSGLSSPLGSELGSTTETESDEDEFIAELTRQMADYMLQEDDDEKTKVHEPSLATTRVKSPSTGFYYNKALFDNHTQPINHMKNKDTMRNQGSVGWERRGKMSESTQYVENNRKGRACGFSNINVGGRVHPQQAGSGMRAIFLGGSGSRNRSSGTGVFLPRGTGNTSETRNKQRCSTVLIPERVMKALQLHYDDVNGLSRSNDCSASNANHRQHDIVMGESKGMDLQVQKTHFQSQTQPVTDHQEMCLPHEWTY